MTDLDTQKARELAQSAIERAEKAIGAQWAVKDDGYDYSVYVVEDRPSWGTLVVAEKCNQGEHGETAAFIAAARTDVPELATALLQALAETERLRLYEWASREYENALGVTSIPEAIRLMKDMRYEIEELRTEIDSQQDLKKRINDLEIENNSLRTAAGWRIYFEQHAKPLRDEIARLTELVERKD